MSSIFGCLLIIPNSQRRTFPFTSSVPIFCNRIKNAVSDMNDFGKDFSGPEMNSAIVKVRAVKTAIWSTH